MAFQTERHAERFVVVNFHHLVNPAVTLYAANATVDVDGMVEINVVGSFVDSDPRYGWTIENAISVYILFSGKLAVFVRVLSVVGRTNGFEQRGVGFDRFVTRHAHVGRGNACMSRFVDGSVTISAIKAELASVELVVVGYGLGGLIAYSRVFGGSIVSDAGNNGSPGHAQGNDQLDWYGVDPARKNITHEMNDA